MKTNCESCGKRINESDAHWTDENLPYCNECTEEMSQTCSCCGCVDPVWQMSGTSDDLYYCQDCATAIA